MTSRGVSAQRCDVDPLPRTFCLGLSTDFLHRTIGTGAILSVGACNFPC